LDVFLKATATPEPPENLIAKTAKIIEHRLKLSSRMKHKEKDTRLLSVSRPAFAMLIGGLFVIVLAVGFWFYNPTGIIYPTQKEMISKGLQRTEKDQTKPGSIAPPSPKREFHADEIVAAEEFSLDSSYWDTIFVRLEIEIKEKPDLADSLLSKFFELNPPQYWREKAVSIKQK
jgi:hypothetical protein